MARFSQKKLQQIARGKGLDAAKLARRADLGQQTVYNIWDGKVQNPGIKTLLKIARALGTQIEDLLEEDAQLDLVPIGV